MNRMNEAITLEEAVDYSKIDISSIDFSKVESVMDARHIPLTRGEYYKALNENTLVGLTEESFSALNKAFIDYIFENDEE